MCACTRIVVVAVAAAALCGWTRPASSAPCPVRAPDAPAAHAAVLPPCSAPTPALPYLDYAIAQIPGRIDKYLQLSRVPGLAIAVVHGGREVYSQGFGVANMNTGARVDADTVFQLASISKPVGSTVVSTQVTAGKVWWSTPVGSGLPWFALGQGSGDGNWVSQAVAIGDMYAHRSGLPDHAGDDLEGLGYDQKTILERLRYLPLAPFRASYAYTNYGLTAAAEAVAQKVGVPWVQLCDEALYKPLGMTRTTSGYDTYDSFANHAIGHSPIDDNLDGAWRVTPVQFNADRATAAAGVASSANDMAKWMLMLLSGGKSPGGKQLIDPAVLRDSMSAQNIIALGPDATLQTNNGLYGYGFLSGQTGKGLKFASHAGAFSQGTSTNFEIVPALDLGIVVLTNGFPLGLSETVSADFIDLAQFGQAQTDYFGFYQAAFRNAIKEAFGASKVACNPPALACNPPADAKPAKPLNQYAGTYRNDYFGDAVVTLGGDALQLHMGPAGGGMTWTLTHWDGDVFKLRQGTVDVSQTAVSAITFDFSGPKVTLTHEYYQKSSDGRGVLTRVE